MTINMAKEIHLSFILDVELEVGTFFSEFLAKVEGIRSFLQLAS